MNFPEPPFHITTALYHCCNIPKEQEHNIKRTRTNKKHSILQIRIRHRHSRKKKMVNHQKYRQQYIKEMQNSKGRLKNRMSKMAQFQQEYNAFE